MSPHSLEATHIPNVPQALEAVDADHLHGMPEYGSGAAATCLVLRFRQRWHYLSLGDLPSPGFHHSCFLSVSRTFTVKDKHGSDIEVYDTDGSCKTCMLFLTELGAPPVCKFVPEKFEELFSKFAKSDKTRLHFDEILTLTNANMNAYDLFGWSAAKLGWLFAYLLVRDDNDFVSNEHIRGFYNGSWPNYIIARRRNLKNSKFLRGWLCFMHQIMIVSTIAALIR